MTTTTIKVDRFDDGKPRRFTSVGGYPIYYVTAGGECLCPDCAGIEEAEGNDDPIVGTDINWEDPAMYCIRCDARIESAYAEDEAENA